jgi:putative ABC transport system permease protein
MEEQIVGLLLGFAMVIAILIGVGITSQTLRGAVASNIREFASLRALGVSMPALRGVVVELSFWVGIAGLLGTAALMGLVMAAARAAHVALSLPLPYVGGVALLLMAISLVSGFLSLGALARTQPAELLR